LNKIRNFRVRHSLTALNMTSCNIPTDSNLLNLQTQLVAILHYDNAIYCIQSTIKYLSMEGAVEQN